jgi:predicted small secreted protein
MLRRTQSPAAATKAEAVSPAGFLPLTMVLLLAAMVALSACNTMEGLGQDVEAAGSTMSGTAEDVEEDM